MSAQSVHADLEKQHAPSKMHTKSGNKNYFVSTP